MRIDGFSSSNNYPVNRKARKSPVREEGLEDVDGEFEAISEFDPETVAQKVKARLANLPARQQDMIFNRTLSKQAAMALASYLATAHFTEMEVLGLDLYI